MTLSIWTLVPMRGIERGKSRLAPVLDDAGRIRLNRWLLDNTLAVIGRWRGNLRHCIVVSPCDQALEIARRAGALDLQETPDADDLNRALALGAMQVAANGADKLLILPCDLPGLTADSLETFAAEGMRPQHMVLAPDAVRAGTNALLVDALPDVEFQFGAMSFARHQAWAAARGWSVTVCARPELEFDLDTPQDFAAWPGSGLYRRDAKMAQPLQRSS